MWITLLDPFALHTPFHHSRPVVFGLMENDVLCATMTMTIAVGVDVIGFFLGCFLLTLYHITAKNRKKAKRVYVYPRVTMPPAPPLCVVGQVGFGFAILTLAAGLTLHGSSHAGTGKMPGSSSRRGERCVGSHGVRSALGKVRAHLPVS